MSLKTVNGTGTGEIVLFIHTVDKIPLSGTFLYEAKKPGTYGERFSISTVPDPDCDPTTRKYLISKKISNKIIQVSFFS